MNNKSLMFFIIGIFFIISIGFFKTIYAEKLDYQYELKDVKDKLQNEKAKKDFITNLDEEMKQLERQIKVEKLRNELIQQRKLRKERKKDNVTKSSSENILNNNKDMFLLNNEMYLIYIMNSGSDKEAGININERIFNVKEGDKVQKYYVKEIKEEEVIVVFDKKEIKLTINN